MLHLLFYFAFMFATGTSNAMYYADRPKASMGFIFLVSAMLLVYFAIVVQDLPLLNKWLMLLGYCITSFFNFRKIVIFDNDDSDNVHSNEYLVNGSFVLGMFFFAKVDGLTYIFGMHLAGVIFNLMVNRVSSGQFLEVVDFTDDPTGRTVGVKIFGDWYKIPRISNSYVQLALGLCLTSLWVYNYYNWGYKITWATVVEWAFKIKVFVKTGWLMN